MDRKDAVNLAVGAILLGGAVVIVGSLLPHWALAIVGELCFALGLYVIVGGVYFGLPTPVTAAHHAWQPKLANPSVEIESVTRQPLLHLRVDIENTGRANLSAAGVNLVVPAFFKSLIRVDQHGSPAVVAGPGSFVVEGQVKYWTGRGDFPGRMLTQQFFAAELVNDPPDRFPVEIKVFDPHLDEPLLATIECVVRGKRGGDRMI